MRSALQTAHDDLVTKTSELRADADKMMTGWDPYSESRVSQQDYDKRLGQSISDFAESMLTMQSALRDIDQLAYDAEVDCVALVDG